jgi:serpin B
MTYAGAHGETAKEMAGVLRFSLPPDEVHSAYASLLASLNPPDKEAYELHLANRLWGQTGYGFKAEYLAITRKQYGAELAQVDYINEAEPARREINAWVAAQTNQKIENLLPQGSVSDLTRLVLTNAIYFKGKWVHPFEKKLTKDSPFTVFADKKVEVPLMYQKKKFNYAETPELQILEMPYVGDDLSMMVLLPKQSEGLLALEKMLTAENLDKWIANLRKQEVQAYIPRFTITEQFQLNSSLAALGMPTAFEPGKADFSGMNGRMDLFISAAIHKAFVDVNEEGTEAVAATGIIVGVTSLPPPPKVFRADHPFVFLIRDRLTGTILFLGCVVNPVE